jgi:hypothetical protein
MYTIRPEPSETVKVLQTLKAVRGGRSSSKRNRGIHGGKALGAFRWILGYSDRLRWAGLLR